MAFFGLTLPDLVKYQPERPEPADFDAFWSATVAAARAHPADLVTAPADTSLVTVAVDDAVFPGYGGQPVKCWLIRPAHGVTGPLPAVVTYLGYGSGRGLAHEHLLWASAGYLNLVMDTRGQGAANSVGDTPDDAPLTGPAYPGFMTRGIQSPDTYYYRRVYADAVRAVDALRLHPAADPRRILVAGASQGGGIALAVAGLVPGLAGVIAEVPFLQHIQHAAQITDAFPVKEVAEFCRIHRDKADQVAETLSYFDGLNFAARATAPARYTVGLMDEICPPETVYASYNHYAGQKEIGVYPYNRHEGGGPHGQADALRFASRVLRQPEG
jgi:cephalosporin-C deacetylase